MYNGFVTDIYKRKRFSHDVVAKLQGILRQKKVVMDPNAEELLPVCLEEQNSAIPLTETENSIR